MRPIPTQHKKIIATDPYFRVSCLSGEFGKRNDRIVIHHPWIYAGKQINEVWAYMPLLNSEHENLNLELRNKIKYLSLLRVDINEVKSKYPRHNWDQEFKYLKKMYGGNTNCK